ncbi:MAG: ABC transporter permease subunit [Christensenellaceae bacterium]|nr:ABC transporter permease subunit [Christensenellaceae bacterium]
MLAVYKKELKGFFNGMMGYVFCAFLLVVAGVLTMDYCLGPEPTNTFEYIYGNMPIVYIIIIPILAMNTIAGEMRNKTDQMLYTSPVSITKIVMGKYLAMCTVLLIPLAITAIYPFILTTYGNIAIWTCLASMFSFFLLGCSLIAVCMFVSSLTESQILSAVISFGVLFLLYTASSLQYYIGRTELSSAAFFCAVAAIFGFVVRKVTRSIGTGIGFAAILIAGVAFMYFKMPETLCDAATKLVGIFAAFTKIENFIGGIFDLNIIVYYLSIILFFNYLCVQSIDKRRWS